MWVGNRVGFKTWTLGLGRSTGTSKIWVDLISVDKKAQIHLVARTNTVHLYLTA